MINENNFEQRVRERLAELRERQSDARRQEQMILAVMERFPDAEIGDGPSFAALSAHDAATHVAYAASGARMEEWRKEDMNRRKEAERKAEIAKAQPVRVVGEVTVRPVYGMTVAATQDI